MSSIIGNNAPPTGIDRTLVDKLNEEAKRERRPIKAPTAAPQQLVDCDDYITFHNVRCVGSDGKIFESYERIEVAKDVIRDQNGRPHRFTTLEANAYLKERGDGSFLPSCALQMNILIPLFYGTRMAPDDRLVTPLIKQYMDGNDGIGEHLCNTIVNWHDQIVDYPGEEEIFKDVYGFPGQTEPRQLGPKVRAFKEEIRRGLCPLSAALEDPLKKQYLQDLTGLKEPKGLVELAKHYGKGSVFGSPSPHVVNEVRFGAYRSYFNILTYYTGNGNSGIVRAVRVPGGDR